MSWERKDRPTPFDTQPIAGLYFLDGDVVGDVYRQDWMRGHKYPLIEYPSGVERQLRGEAGNEVIRIFGAFDLPLRSTCDEAVALATASDYGHLVGRRGDAQLIINDPRSGRGYLIEYDSQNGQLANIVFYPREAMELLNDVSRALLPPLYHNEAKGLAAVAPVKFFTPDSRWSWYLTEFDGDDLLFGLVSGFEVELGYVSLSELESVRGPLGLPVERDLYYHPRTLREIQAYERQLKRL